MVVVKPGGQYTMGDALDTITGVALLPLGTLDNPMILKINHYLEQLNLCLFDEHALEVNVEYPVGDLIRLFDDSRFVKSKLTLDIPLAEHSNFYISVLRNILSSLYKPSFN